MFSVFELVDFQPIFIITLEHLIAYASMLAIDFLDSFLYVKTLIFLILGYFIGISHDKQSDYLLGNSIFCLLPFNIHSIYSSLLGDKMLDISLVSAVSAVVAAIGVLVGVVFTVLELRNLVKARQTDLAVRLYQHFGTKEFMNSWWQITAREEKDYKEYVKKYGGADLLQVGVFFEGIGILLHRKLMDINMAGDLFSESIKLIWEKNESILKEMVEQRNIPEAWQWFEYLYNEMQKREQRLHQTQQ